MMKPDAKCSLKGQVALVKENGEWKIDKDFWKFESVGKDGKFSQSSGLNPDRDDDKAGAGSSDQDGGASSRMSSDDDKNWAPSENDDLLDRTMKLWKRDKSLSSA